MSGIVGAWNIDGRPLDVAVLDRMSGTLHHRGPDGEGRHVMGSIGLACQHLWVTPEDVGEVQPLVGRAGVMLAMDGRLDNRDELLPALGLSRTASDAACALAAYEVWDDRFAERLNGDFALAVFDESKQRLLLARDSIGMRPLYYFHNDYLFAFASEIKALLVHPDVPVRPDDEGIADFMMLGFRPVDRQELTCFAGVSALVPAHLAIITPARVVTRRYWDFDTGRILKLRSFDEYVEAFRERFAEAVRRRARSAHPVTVSVSGGLDSSSILCQAQVLQRMGKANCSQLVGISYIGSAGTGADERRYSLEIEREFGVEIDRFPVELFANLTEAVDEQVYAIEVPFLDHMGIIREVHRRARARDSRVLLSGHWGDQVLFSSAYLVDLFRRLAWGDIRRHLHEYTRYFGPAMTQVLARRVLSDIVRHHVPGPLVRPLKWARLRLFRGGHTKPWFSDAFSRRALRFADRPARIGEGFHSAQARSIYLEARSKYHVLCMEWNNKTAASHGLEAAFPFLDRDLLALLMATPGEIQNRHGIPRALLREAMRGVLPELIRVRKSKGDFTAVVNKGMIRSVDLITERLSGESLAVKLGYLDAGRLGPELVRLSEHLAGPDCVAGWNLADLCGLETWLQVFLANRASFIARRPFGVRESVS